MDPAILEQLLDRLSAGESLRSICRTPGFPAESSVRFRVVDDPAFAAQYARARSVGLDSIAEQIVELADVCREGAKTERKHVGWQCSACGLAVAWAGLGWLHANNTMLCAGATAQRVYEEKIVTGDMVERAKLQLDARKWLLSKMRPDKYGDRVTQEVTGPAGAPLQLGITLRRVDKPEPL